MATAVERLNRFQQELRAMADVESAKAVLGRTLADLGFPYFTCALIDALRNPRAPFFLTNYPAEWLDHYHRAGLRQHDPVFRNAADRNAPTLWTDADRRYAIPTTGALVFGPSTEFGLAHGAGLGAFGPAGQIINLQVADAGSRRAFEALFQHRRHDLQLLIYYAHEHILRLTGIERALEQPLTPRQREVLLWSMRGKTYWEIGEILNLAEDTVRQHSQAACRRLGAGSRIHAVALAISRGFIAP